MNHICPNNIDIKKEISLNHSASFQSTVYWHEQFLCKWCANVMNVQGQLNTMQSMNTIESQVTVIVTINYEREMHCTAQA